MPEREGKPQEPPIVVAVRETKEFAEKVEDNPDFKQLVTGVIGSLGEGDPSELREASESLVKNGVSQAIGHIGLLPAFSNPEARKEVLLDLKKNKQEGSWITLMENWNTEEDPFGVSLLEACKQADLADFKENALKNSKTDEQKQHISKQAAAIAKGQDLAISFYKSKVSEHHSPMAKAA